MIVYAAKHVLPVASTPIPNGAVLVHEGRIMAVGRRRQGERRREWGGGDPEVRSPGRAEEKDAPQQGGGEDRQDAHRSPSSLRTVSFSSVVSWDFTM